MFTLILTIIQEKDSTIAHIPGFKNYDKAVDAGNKWQAVAFPAKNCDMSFVVVDTGI